MAPTVEKLPTLCSGFSEGPHWDVDTQSLFLVDLIQVTLIRYEPVANKSFSAKLDLSHLSFVIPVAGSKGEFVVGSGLTLYLVKWDGRSEKVDSIDVLCTIEGDQHTKVNDAKCDSTGRIWFGTVCSDKSTNGKLFSYTKNEGCLEHTSGIMCSNGITWNQEETKMYHIDSFTSTVTVYDFNRTGKIGNQKMFFDLKKNGIPGFPDGMTNDIDGNLWVACFSGGQVINIDSKTGELLQTVEIPTLQVTSVAWGGPNLEDLFVTSGDIDSPDFRKDEISGNAGYTYKVSGLSTAGLPMRDFKL